MSDKSQIVPIDNIQSRIFIIRGVQVMLDSDLAELYQVETRKFISQNANLFQRINNIEQKQIVSDIKQLETDNKIDAILDAIESGEIKPKQGIF